jgi:hypothetical protein
MAHLCLLIEIPANKVATLLPRSLIHEVLRSGDLLAAFTHQEKQEFDAPAILVIDEV